MSPLASLLMLLLLWGSACAGVWGSPAGTGAGQQPQSPQRFPVSRYRSYQLRVQEVVTVQEGLCVSIPCTFSHPWMGWVRSDPAHGYWFREQTDVLTGAPVATNNPERKVEEGTRGRFQLLGDPKDGSCSLLVRDARRQDAAKYFFQVERGNIVKYNYKEHMVTLRVTDLMQKPDIYVPETLEPGCPATLLCVFPGDSEGCPSPTFSWTGVALSSQGAAPRNYISFSVLPVTPRPQDHKAWLTCGVELKNGVSSSNKVQLRVAHAPKDLIISFSLTNTSVRRLLGKDSRVDVKKGQFLRLLCAADGHPPPTLSWVLSDRVLSWSPPSGPRSLILELPQVGPKDAGRYTCRSENRLGSQQRWLDLSVHYPPENLSVMVSPANRTAMENFTNGMALPVLAGQSLCLICVADSRPPATLSWDWGKLPLNLSQSSDPGVLELPRVQKEDEGEVTCRARNSLGSQHVTLHLSVLYPPELLGPSCSWEAEGLRCNCSARARPVPSLLWWVGDRLVEGNSSNIPVTVTSISEGPWANSSLTLHEQLSLDLGLHCEARNDHGLHRVTVLQLPGSPEPGGGSVLAAALGAGLTALLGLCSCLIFLMVKTCRTKTARPAAGGPRGRSVSSDTSPGHQWKSQPGRPPDASPLAVVTSPPAVASSHLEEDQELHYASLVFRGLKPQEPQDQEDTSTNEYSEIMIWGLKPQEPQDQEDTSTNEYSEIKAH